MGGEFGQWREWTETESLDWHLLEDSLHGGVQRLVRDLNRVYGPENALWETDSEPAGFEWIDVDNALENIVAFVRRSPQTDREIVCVCNFSAVAKKNYKLRLAERREYSLIVDSDAEVYGGSGNANIDKLSDGEIDLPPLTSLWFAPTNIKNKKIRSTKSAKTE
jgi:1,4-alpha-glucan branching enzyme